MEALGTVLGSCARKKNGPGARRLPGHSPIGFELEGDVYAGLYLTHVVGCGDRTETATRYDPVNAPEGLHIVRVIGDVETIHLELYVSPLCDRQGTADGQSISSQPGPMIMLGEALPKVPVTRDAAVRLIAVSKYRWMPSGRRSRRGVIKGVDVEPLVRIMSLRATDPDQHSAFGLEVKSGRSPPP